MREVLRPVDTLLYTRKIHPSKKKYTRKIHFELVWEGFFFRVSAFFMKKSFFIRIWCVWVISLKFEKSFYMSKTLFSNHPNL